MNRHLPLILPAAAGVVLILLTTIVQGVWTDRWAPTHSEELEVFAAALRNVPDHIGDWETQETTEMDPREREAAGAYEDLSRTYRNPHTQDVVSVYLICGASRHVAVHTPDACYVGSGFRIEDKIRPYTIRFGDSSAEFRTAQFLKEDRTTQHTVRVFWAWNASGNWEAPDMPRMKYGGRTPLNKLYLITRTTPGAALEDSPAIEFAEVFLPAVTDLLFPPPAKDAAAPASSKPKEGKAPADPIKDDGPPAPEAVEGPAAPEPRSDET